MEPEFEEGRIKIMSLQEEMVAALRSLQPETVEVINESAKHQGHAGDDGSGESHFTIVIEAPAFADMNRLAHHGIVVRTFHLGVVLA